MGIAETKSLLHWNYFLALEQDIEVIARYIELSKRNYPVYSIELARILLSSSSEVDVLAKMLCTHIDSKSTASNIFQYREALRPVYPEIENAEVTIPRHGLTLEPWVNWKKNETPLWWAGYNSVKHQRDENFHDANLQNVLNSMSALFVLMLIYHRDFADVERLEPPPNLLTPSPEIAAVYPAIGGRMAMSFNR